MNDEQYQELFKREMQETDPSGEDWYELMYGGLDDEIQRPDYELFDSENDY